MKDDLNLDELRIKSSDYEEVKKLLIFIYRFVYGSLSLHELRITTGDKPMDLIKNKKQSLAFNSVDNSPRVYIIGHLENPKPSDYDTKLTRSEAVKLAEINSIDDSTWGVWDSRDDELVAIAYHQRLFR